jgi:spore maturation protein CgeB
VPRRLQRITLNYGGYLAAFAKRTPGFERLEYEHQYKALMEDGFGWADFLTKNLVPLGWEAWEPVTNFEAHQRTWASENDVRFREESWFHEIAAAQIKHFQPDVLFVDSFTAFDAAFIQQIRRDIPNLQCVVGWCGAPPPDYSVFHAFDVTLSNIPSLVDFLRRQHVSAELLPHSFEVSMLRRDEDAPEHSVDFSFTGSVFDGSDHHGERLSLLAELCKSTSLEIYADVAVPRPLETVRSLVRSPQWKVFKSHLDKARVARRCKPSVYGVDMYKLLHRSKITFNNHIGLSHEHASNTRLFQATGCGACLLTDWKPDLAKYFEPDVEVVTYRNAEEAGEKARWLLDNEPARREIAERGNKRTLRDHTFAARTNSLLEILEKYL